MWDALRAGGRAVFQEHDAVLSQVLGQYRARRRQADECQVRPHRGDAYLGHR